MCRLLGMTHIGDRQPGSYVQTVKPCNYSRRYEREDVLRRRTEDRQIM
jgi:hypothetical protein